MNIPAKKDIWHLVERGIVAEVTLDTETGDVNRHFNTILDCGMVVSDLGGQVVTTHALAGRLPDYRTVSPYAALVNRRSPAEWDQGDPPYILAGKIAGVLHHAAGDVWQSLTDEERITPLKNGVPGKPEAVRLMPFQHDDGSVGHIRLHDQGKYMSFPVDRGHGDYHDADGQGWRKKRAGIQVNHYYGIRADDPWLWSLFDQANMPDLFLTHTRRFDERKAPAWRTDIHKLAQMVFLYGPKGESGLQAVSDGARVSFRLEQLMQANTHHASPARGVAEGVRMPDQSAYNPARGHQSALYDALATLGLKNHLRRIAPDLVRHAEEMADLSHIREFVQGYQGFQDNPVIGLGRVIAGMPDTSLAMVVGMDEQIGDQKNILMIRVDRDLSQYRYRGQRLTEMGVDDLALMMQEQQNRPDALFAVAHLRKNPIIVPAETAFHTGGHDGADPEWVEENRRFVLSNPGLVDRAMQAFEKAQPVFPRPDQIANPFPEDEIFSQLGDLPRYQTPDDRGVMVDIPENIHFHADQVRQHQIKIDRLLKKLVAPDPVEWLADDAGVLADFKERVKKTAKSLQEIEPDQALPPLPLDIFKAASSAKSTDQAVAALWQMRKALIGHFYDTGLHYEVLDERDNPVSFDNLVAMTGRERQARFDQKLLHVQFDQLPSRPSTRKVARMFWDAGKIDDLGPEWRDFMTAEIAVYQHGVPMLDDSQQRLMTGPRALRDIDRLQQNDDGLYDRFGDHTQRAPEILAGAKDYIQQQMDRFPLTPAAMVMMGWNPHNGHPIEAIRYEIAPDNLLVIDVPDPVLKKPLQHPAVSSAFVLLVPPPDQLLEKALAAGAPIALRGAESGRLFLAPGAFVTAAPDRTAFDRVYQQAAAGYADVGYRLDPDADGLRVMGFAALVPLANTRKIDDRQPSLKIPLRVSAPPGLLFFDGLVSGGLAMMDQPLKGLILRQYEYCPQPGPLRLLETGADGHETGWELAGAVTASNSLTLIQLRQQVRRGEWPETRTRDYGFANGQDLLAQVSKLFEDDLIRPDHHLANPQKIMILDLAPVDRASMVWNPRHIVPEATLERDFLGENPDFDLAAHLAPSTLIPLQPVMAAPRRQRRL